MSAFRETGRFTLDPATYRTVRECFDGFRLDDPGTLAEIKRCRASTGELLDPHSAIGVAAARQVSRPDVQAVVALATAHPAKFPDAVEQASGIRPELPERLSDLLERPEKLTALPNDLARIQDYVRSHASASNRRGLAPATD